MAQSGLDKAKHLLNLLGGVLLAAPEDVRLGARSVANLMHLGHGPVRDQADQSILRQEAEAHNQGLLESSQAVFLLARIDDIEEDGWARSRSRQPVFDGRVGWVQLGGDGISGDILVVRRERVPREAEGADPEASAHVDLAGVESAPSL